MFIHQFRNGILSDIIYFRILFLFMLNGLPTLWNVYFVKRIWYFLRLYRRSKEEDKSEAFDDPKEKALHYKVELVKYIFLLIINNNEMSIVIIDQLGLLMTSIKRNNTALYDCTSGTTDISNIAFHLISNPWAAVFIAVGQVGLLLTFALGISLMKYLDATYHNIYDQSLKYAKIFILTSCVIGVLLLITGSVRKSIIPQKIISPIVLLVYFYIWIRQARKFYNTLRWRSVEFIVRGRSSQVVKRAVKSSYHFGIIMSLLGIGLFSIIIADLLDDYFFLFAAFAFCPNIIHQIYGTVGYEPLLTEKMQIHVLVLGSDIITGISIILSSVAFLTIGSQYISATLVFFGEIVVKKLKYRFGRVRTRFTPSFSDPLLIA